MTNVKLLRKTLATVEKAAERGEWNQRVYAIKTDCGTAYCFAGWALHNAGYVPIFDPELGEPESEHFTLGKDPIFDPEAYTYEDNAFKLASELLELDELDADALFDWRNSIRDLRRIVTRLIDEEGSSERGD